MGPVPFANERMARVIQRAFPEFDLEIMDVVSHVKRRRLMILVNAIHMLREYFVPLLLGRRRPSECFFSTAYMFRALRKVVRMHFSTGRYVFSFQMQSLFDGSLPGIPHFVYTDHTHLANLAYSHFDRRNLSSRAWRDLEPSIYHNACMTFVRSTNVGRSLIEEYGCRPESIQCIFAGPNADLRPLSEGKDYSPTEILFVGMDWVRKGGPVLLEAFRSLRGEFASARLTVVGCTPLVDLPNCHIAGRVSLDSVHRYYEAATVFCLPTKVEPFGIAFVEALHHGLPVVATNVGAIPDFVRHGHNGLLVPPGSVEHLAAALRSLLKDAGKRRLYGERGRELARDRYTWERVGSLARASIAEALEGGGVVTHDDVP